MKKGFFILIILFLPFSFSDAMTLEDQINVLQKEVEKLMVELSTQSNQTNSPFINLVRPSFSRVLKLGDLGEDVRMLQEILNQDSDTQVVSFGVGSPGNETDYFGSLTLNAVQRFQNKYAQEILFPLGLSTGTGFIGNSTLAKLNSLVSAGSDVVDTSQSINTTSFKIISISPSNGKVGTKITLKGEGFLNTKQIVTTFEAFSDFKIVSDNEITFDLDFKNIDLFPSVDDVSDEGDDIEDGDGYLYEGNAEIPISLVIKKGSIESNSVIFYAKP
jgi:peptidoglycan hydrolase-like protein with peptidoglycan-binding domain